MKSITEEGKLLAKINDLLAEHGLKSLASLGTSRTAVRIVGIPEILDVDGYYFLLRYPTQDQHGKNGTYTLRSSANSAVSDGAIFLVRINGRLALVKQPRLALGSTWTYEVPRIFGKWFGTEGIPKSSAGLKVNELPLDNIFFELGGEIRKLAASRKIDSITHLGAVASDSGTSADTPDIYLVNVTFPEDAVAGALGNLENGTRVVLWDWEEAWDAFGTKIRDAHSIAALAMLRNLEEMDSSN